MSAPRGRAAMRKIVGVHGGRRDVRMLCMNGGPDVGPKRWTFTYGLACGHEAKRVHKTTSGSHPIGQRLKCETCTAGPTSATEGENP